MSDINPLNVLNQREVIIMPPHFTKINHKINYVHTGRTHNDVVNHIKDWIFNNLDGRFTVSEYERSTNNKWAEYIETPLGGYEIQVTIGFELPEESTFFSLAYQGFPQI